MSNPYETGRFAAVSDVDQVASRDDVARVVREMVDDLRRNPGAWENSTLERFLDALSVSLTALPNLYANRGESFPDQPNWKILAEALVMASGYE
ncbi:DUF7660 family protein [Salinispora arenicola]|uniref:DUF7660 family protein n=1 Tax=Salinispora arenicola TaxID=168697 RepID=UPI0003AA2FE1|nr:hypothetical protein [Salinispora arenicola]